MEKESGKFGFFLSNESSDKLFINASFHIVDKEGMITALAKFHHCSRTLVCHRSSTLKVKMYVQKTCHMSHMRGSATHHPRGCRSALGSTPQCILCHTGSSESRTSCCLLAVVTLKRFMVNSSPSNS